VGGSRVRLWIRQAPSPPQRCHRASERTPYVGGGYCIVPASLRSEHQASTAIHERESQFNHHVQHTLTSDVQQRGDVNEAIDSMAENSRCGAQ
jgi:hypothetical protein